LCVKDYTRNVVVLRIILICGTLLCVKDYTRNILLYVEHCSLLRIIHEILLRVTNYTSSIFVC